MINVQLPYSLIDRAIEPEFVPMAQTLGMGLTAWSPIAGGLLTGKYRRGATLIGNGRLHETADLTDRDWRVIEALETVAAELGRPMAQVAVNWVATQPAVASAIIGASSVEQLDSNLAALDFEIPADARGILDKAAAWPLPKPYSMFTPAYQSWIVHPNLTVAGKPAGYWGR